MNEFAALVEERCVVLVALDDKPLTFGKSRSLSEIVRDPPDQVAWIATIVLEDPCEQRGRRGLSVCASDNQRAFAANEVFFEQLRKRAVTELPLQNIFRLRVAA